MAQFKVVVSDPATGKSEVIEAKDSAAQFFVGRHIGEVVDLSAIGHNFKVKITGGSDKAGFPMRGDVLGSGKRHVLLTEGVGFRNSVEGEKRRKLVRGATISEEVYQLNVAKWAEPEKAVAPPPAKPA